MGQTQTLEDEIRELIINLEDEAEQFRSGEVEGRAEAERRAAALLLLLCCAGFPPRLPHLHL